MKLRRWPMLMAVCWVPAAFAQVSIPPQSPAQANDERARLGRFQPPPPPVVAPQLAPPGGANPQRNTDGAVSTRQPQRRLWRDLTDALLDLMVPRSLIAGVVLDDPLTTGFGNPDFIEPLPDFSTASLDGLAPANVPDD